MDPLITGRGFFEHDPVNTGKNEEVAKRSPVTLSSQKALSQIGLNPAQKLTKKVQNLPKIPKGFYLQEYQKPSTSLLQVAASIEEKTLGPSKNLVKSGAIDLALECVGYGDTPLFEDPTIDLLFNEWKELDLMVKTIKLNESIENQDSYGTLFQTANQVVQVAAEIGGYHTIASVLSKVSTGIGICKFYQKIKSDPLPPSHPSKLFETIKASTKQLVAEEMAQACEAIAQSEEYSLEEKEVLLKTIQEKYNQHIQKISSITSGEELLSSLQKFNITLADMEAKYGIEASQSSCLQKLEEECQAFVEEVQRPEQVATDALVRLHMDLTSLTADIDTSISRLDHEEKTGKIPHKKAQITRRLLWQLNAEVFGSKGRVEKALEMSTEGMVATSDLSVLRSKSHDEREAWAVPALQLASSVDIKKMRMKYELATRASSL